MGTVGQEFAMGKPRREGYEQWAGIIPADVMAALRRLAVAHGCKLVEEIVHAMKRHVAYPPELTPLPDSPAARKKPTRKKKAEPPPQPKEG